MDFQTFIAGVTLTCEEIGNCPTKSPTVWAGLANVAQILTLLVGMLAVIFVIVSGLQMALANGDSKRYGQARQALLYSVVGVGVAIIGYAAVAFIAGSL